MKNLIRVMLATTILISLSIITLAQQAAQTRMIPFQGRLTNATNQVVPNNVYNVIFRIYNAPTGGSPLWIESHVNVSIISGQINVLLGSLTSLDDPDGNGNQDDVVDFRQPRYLGIAIGSGQEMIPRHQLVPSFHAQTTSLAFDSELLDGQPGSFYATKQAVDLLDMEVANQFTGLDIRVNGLDTSVDALIENGLPYVNRDMGIKTTNPDTDLDVAGSISINAGGSVYLEGSEGALGDSYISYIQADGRVAVYEDGTEGLTIKEGKVGVGNPDPTSKLHVNGDLTSSSLATGGVNATALDVNGRVRSRGISVIKNITSVSGNSSVACPAGYVRSSGDLNAGASGDYVFLCIQRAD